jgi:putative nucleotidyltransferase with HDIG domain
MTESGLGKGEDGRILNPELGESILPDDPQAELDRTRQQLEFEITRRVMAERERDRLLVAERQQRLLAETLKEISVALNQYLDHNQVLSLILKHLRRLVDYDHASVMLVSGDSLNVVARRGDETDFQEYDYPKIEALPYIQEVLRSARPLVIPITSQEPLWISLPANSNIRSWLGVPLKAKEDVIGLLDLNKEQESFYNQGDGDLARMFATHVGIAIENARLFEGTRQQVERLAALREIDTAITASLDRHLTLNILLEQVVNTLSVDAAEILLLAPPTQTLKSACQRGHAGLRVKGTEYRLGQGLPGQAALERRTLAFPDLTQPPPGSGGAEAEGLLRSGLGAYFAVPLVAKAQVKGVLQVFHRSPLSPDPDWLAFLETLAGQAAIAIDNAALFDDLQRSNTELTLAYDTTLEGWARALELRDKETEGHTQRVSEMTLRLAQAMGMPDADLLHVRRGALLHDIGKMGIPDSILLKPGPLSAEEWQIMRRHPLYAYEMLSPIAYLRPALDIPYAHHEKWDGSGYPRGLAGEQIPLPARIFAVADVWDALLSDRPYRPAWSEEAALEFIRGQAGRHFDPRVVELFLTLVEVAQFELVG